jgi:hypothetical protein
MNQGRSTSLRAKGGNQKMMPRDLTEGFSKLPPQAIDFEEVVLATLLIEAKQYESVKDFLFPDHFYLETHKVVYEAIVEMHKANKPVDMRTVSFYLKQIGKLELVGGQFFIAELTSKVSGSADIEYRSRIIVEMALKRELIQLASQAQSLAYDDTTDVFTMMDDLKEKLENIKSTNVTEPIEAKIKSLWKEVILEEEPQEEVPILWVNERVVGTAGNHSLVIGKKKSRKTLFLVWLIGKYLQLPGTNPKSVIFFDTEQGKSHVWKILKKVEKMTGIKITVVYLRGRTPQERKDIIEWTLKHWETPVRLAFIDGIRDCLSNINDIDECTDTIVWLEKLTLTHNVHICNVLHMNKGDDNARGHIGTELANKAQTTIQLELDEKNNCTKVSCESSRDEPFESFAFTHSAEGLPDVIGMPTPEGVITPDETKANIRLIFEDGSMSYSDLVEKTKVYFKKGESKAKHMIADWHRKGWVMKIGEPRSRNTRYSLITENFSELPPLEPRELRPIGVEELPPITPELDFGQPLPDTEMPF